MTATPLGSTTVTQIGLVVSNLDEAVEAWSRLLGFPPTRIVTTDPVDQAHTEYHQQPTPARAKLAFFPLGQVTLELIEPLGEPSTWHDQLTASGPSLHHIAFQIKGMVAKTAYLDAKGLPLVQRGEYTGGRYAYFDGNTQLGTIVELLEND